MGGEDSGFAAESQEVVGDFGCWLAADGFAGDEDAVGAWLEAVLVEPEGFAHKASGAASPNGFVEGSLGGGDAESRAAGGGILSDAEDDGAAWVTLALGKESGVVAGGKAAVGIRKTGSRLAGIPFG